MTINAKTLVQDRFWIIQENGVKIGTLQKQDDNDWIFLGKMDQRETFNNEKALIDRFGAGLFSNSNAGQDVVDATETQEHDVHGYPVNQRAYNPMFDVQKQLPIYTKTPKSKSLFCAGYYIICFEKGWRKAYCPKVITLQRYPFKGPFKDKLEMQQVLNNAIKEQNTDTAN